MFKCEQEDEFGREEPAYLGRYEMKRTLAKPEGRRVPADVVERTDGTEVIHYLA